MAPETEVVLELENLSRSISVNGESRRVVDDVSFRFASGQVFTIVGPSGAGKSSLLRLINRLDEPSSGRVLLRGTSTEQLAPAELRRRVGFLFQRPHLFEGTVADNLRYADSGLSDKRIRELIALARVPQALIEVDAASLSVGEAQRVALARLLALEPEVILLDEPTSALDPTLTEGVEATIRDLVARDGISLILVSHDPLQAIRMGGTVLLVSEGRLAESGPARQVIEAPQSAEGKRYKERKYDADS